MGLIETLYFIQLKHVVLLAILEAIVGIFSSKYKFHLDGKDWCVHMRSRLNGWKYTVTTHGDVVADFRQKDESCVSLLKGTTFDVFVSGQTYHFKIAPVSPWDYGVHVYREGALIYRHKDRDFTTLPKHEKLFGAIDKLDHKKGEDRPFWKLFLEALIYGAILGLLGWFLETYLQSSGMISSHANITPWVVGFGVIFIAFLPSKFRLIK